MSAPLELRRRGDRRRQRGRRRGARGRARGRAHAPGRARAIGWAGTSRTRSSTRSAACTCRRTAGAPQLAHAGIPREIANALAASGRGRARARGPGLVPAASAGGALGGSTRAVSGGERGSSSRSARSWAAPSSRAARPTRHARAARLGSNARDPRARRGRRERRRRGGLPRRRGDRRSAPPELLQCPSYIFRLEGVDDLGAGGLRARAAQRRGRGGDARGRAAERRGQRRGAARSGAPARCSSTLNLGAPRRRAVGAARSAPASARSKRARARRPRRSPRFLRETRPGLRGRAGSPSTRAGSACARRAARSGSIVVSADDVLAGRRRDDEVALSTWPIELWHDHRRRELRVARAAPCSVPLGALVSRTHPRLGMAGRCLSATHEALGALRVIGTALATGEAIGRAAALAADAGVALGAIAPARVREQTRAR